MGAPYANRISMGAPYANRINMSDEDSLRGKKLQTNSKERSFILILYSAQEAESLTVHNTKENSIQNSKYKNKKQNKH